METESEPPDQMSLDTKSAVKILVVEDNLTNQKVIMRQLESLGYEVDIVSHGQAALDATAQTFYPIVLMDCRLPGVDGYTTTRQMRQREQQSQLQKTVIIALTASDEPHVQDEAIASGMDDFLTKPLRRETLATTLERWMQVLNRRQPPSSQNPADLTPEDLRDANLTNAVSSPLDSNLLKLGFDLACLHQLSDHNLEFEQELLQLYLDDTQDQIWQLRQANEKSNLQQIERIAHHIKGASASVGAESLKQIAAALEQEAKRQQLEIASVLVLRLIAVFDQIQFLLSKPV